MITRSLVFIADRITDHANATLESRSLEMLADTYFHQVQTALNKIAPSVTYYPSPDAFLDNITSHKNDSSFFMVWCSFEEPQSYCPFDL